MGKTACGAWGDAPRQAGNTLEGKVEDDDSSSGKKEENSSIGSDGDSIDEQAKEGLSEYELLRLRTFAATGSGWPSWDFSPVPRSAVELTLVYISVAPVCICCMVAFLFRASIHFSGRLKRHDFFVLSRVVAW